MPNDCKSPVVSKGVIYRRTSTEDQLLSIDAQDETVRRIALQRGWMIDRKFTEHESGGNNERPELDKALRHARRIGAVLIVAKLDRLARDQRFLMKLYDGNVRLLFGDLPEIDGSDASRFMVQIMAATAEFERRRMCTRMREWHRARKSKGIKAGMAGNMNQKGRELGAAKSAENRAAALRDEMADIIGVASAERATGRSLRDIARHLNAEGYTTRKGKPWTHTLVLRLLKRVQ